jgi:hypothetical protein
LPGKLLIMAQDEGWAGSAAVSCQAGTVSEGNELILSYYETERCAIGRYESLGMVWSIDPLYEEGFAHPVTLRASVPEGIAIQCVSMMRYEAATGTWVDIPSQTDRAGRTVTVTMSGPELIMPVQRIAPVDLGSFKVYPVPYTPARHTGGLIFDNLPVSASIRIYTITGELVCAVCNDATGQVRWNGRNDSGDEVASGIYIALIKTDSETRKVKIAVER